MKICISKSSSFRTNGAFMFAILLFMAGFTPAHSDNLLTNPGFEGSYTTVPPRSSTITGAVANGWYDNTGFNTASTIVYSKDTSIHYLGVASQKIVVTSSYSQLQQDMPYQAGRYSASIYVKALTPTWVSLGLRQLYTPYAYYGVTSFRATTSWSKITVTGITAALAGTLVFSMATPGTIWVDSANVVFQGVHPAAKTLIPPTTTIPLAYFCLHPLHLAIEDSTLPWPPISFRYARQHDCAPSWATIEPANGTFLWSGLDAFVSAAAAKGRKVLYCFSQTPTWATTDTSLDQYGYRGGNGVPADISYWTTFVSALVARYKGKIAAYEIWNEPTSGFWDGTQAQLVALEQSAAPIIHSADLSALVVSPGITIAGNPSNLSWYEQYLAAGGGSSSDVLACHLYDPSPEDDLQCVPALKALFATYGFASKPYWNTETGWGYAGIGNGNRQQAMDLTIAYLARAYILEWALGFKQFNWYGWSDVGNVGVRQNGSGAWTVLTPGAIAYQQVTTWLHGAKMISCSLDSNGNWVAKITKPGGYSGWIVWNNDTAYNYPVPSAATNEYDLSGHVTPLSGISSVAVSSTPILLQN